MVLFEEPEKKDESFPHINDGEEEIQKQQQIQQAGGYAAAAITAAADTGGPIIVVQTIGPPQLHQKQQPPLDPQQQQLEQQQQQLLQQQYQQQQHLLQQQHLHQQHLHQIEQNHLVNLLAAQNNLPTQTGIAGGAGGDEGQFIQNCYSSVSGSTFHTNSLHISIDDAIERVGMGPFQRRILIAAGLCFAADSMEVLLLSFLSVVLQAQWNLTDEEAANITGIVFLGAIAGTLVLGPLGDIIGRKPVFSITAVIISVFGLGTALANEIKILILMRFFVGFGVGGLTVPFDTLAEFVPNRYRGTRLMIIEFFWTFGTIVTPILAYFTVGNGEEGVDPNAWRWFVVLCAVPCLISAVFGMMVVPESPRWLLAREEHTKALAVLRQAARINGRDPMQVLPTGTRLIDDEVHGYDFCHLLNPEWRPKTLFLWLAWAGFSFVYYGTILLVTMVFVNTQEDNGDQNNNRYQNTLYSFDYAAILTGATSELFGTTLVILFIDRIGRIPTQMISYVAGGISVFCLCMVAHKDSLQQLDDAQEAAADGQEEYSYFTSSSRNTLIATAFIARMFYMSGSCATWVSTAELLTTEIRTTGHSASNAVARLGGSFAPYLVSKANSYPLIGSVLLLISLVTTFAVWHLPETNNKHLGATATEQPTEKIYTQAAAELCSPMSNDSSIVAPYKVFREDTVV